MIRVGKLWIRGLSESQVSLWQQSVLDSTLHGAALSDSEWLVFWQEWAARLTQICFGTLVLIDFAISVFLYLI